VALPQENATLVKVGGGFSEDSDLDAAPVDKWADGGLRIYHLEKGERLTQPDGSNVLVHRSIVLEHGAIPILVEIGDTVTYRVDGASSDSEGRVQATRGAKMPGLMGTIKVWLEDA